MITGADKSQILHELNIQKKIRSSIFRIEENRSNYPVAGGSWQRINFNNNVNYDPLSKWDSVNYDWEVPYTGKYNVSAAMEMSIAHTIWYRLAVFKDATKLLEYFINNRTGIGTNFHTNLSTDVSLTAGEKLSMQVYVSSGLYTVIASPDITYFTAHCISLT
jgi:hypothetical protein